MKKLLLWIFGVVIGLIIITTMIKLFIPFFQSDFYSEKMEKEYLNLFSEQKQDSFFIVGNYNSKVRNQISIFDYGKQKKYSILIYKYPLKRIFS